MKIELTVVGIRYYCGGEENYPELFARLPIGSEVLLQIEKEGSAFPGAIRVFDLEMNQIGHIAKTDIRYINLDVEKETMLTATVTEHSAMDNCIRIEAENTLGINLPKLEIIEAEEGEMVFMTTSVDESITQLTDSVLIQTENLKKSATVSKQRINSYIKVLRKYFEICCSSIDGEYTFKRADITRGLRELSKKYPEFHELYRELLEKSKDLVSRRSNLMVEVYRKQFQAIYDSATAKEAATGKSQLDAIIDNLKFRNGGKLTENIIREEITRLAAQLSKSLDNRYVKCINCDMDFARAVYYSDYTLRSIYVLYTRRIVHDYLLSMLSNGNADEETIEQLAPIFYGSKSDARNFLRMIEGAKPTQVVATANEMIREKKISDMSCNKPLWAILHANGYYAKGLNNWNSQIEK